MVEILVPCFLNLQLFRTYHVQSMNMFVYYMQSQYIQGSKHNVPIPDDIFHDWNTPCKNVLHLWHGFVDHFHKNHRAISPKYRMDWLAFLNDDIVDNRLI